MNCPKCGAEHDPTRCQGHVIKDPITREPIPPRQCEKTPVKGSTVCRSHGAAKGTPAAAKAAERVTEGAAEKVLARTIWRKDASPVTNAVTGLQQLAGQLQAMADALGSRLEEKDLEPITLAALLRVVRELRTALSEMERLGIAERHAEIEAAKVRLMALAADRLMERLGVAAEVRVVERGLFLADLRSLPAPGSGGGGEAA